MTLLSGIIGNYTPSGSLSTTVGGSSTIQNTSGGVSLASGTAGQLYIIVHTASTNSGSVSAPATPSGFTSLTSYSNNKLFSARISYKILTSADASAGSFTFPSVTSAQTQILHSHIFTAASGTFSGATLSSGSTWNYNETDNPSGVIPGTSVGTGGVAGDILLSSYLAIPADTVTTSGFATPSRSVGTGLNPSAIGDHYLFTSSKAFTSTENVNFSVDTTSSSLRVQLGYALWMTNNSIIKPTFA